MKFIPALLAMVVSAAAASTDPGEAAVRFLEKVREKNINLDPGTDTALSPQTSTSKRKMIARRLERMAQDLGKDSLEVGAVKLDAELAGVLVRKISGYDPNRMQVFPVALVKRGEEWAAAPVPASFENSGIGYAAALRKRLDTLEEWMLREQVLDLAKLREQSAERMRRKIEESLPAATLRSFNSRQAAERFLHACEAGNLAEIHGLLGGLEASPPSNWPLRIAAAESAVRAGANVSNPWRLLVSKDVLRVIVLHDDADAKSAMTSIACLDPAGENGPLGHKSNSSSSPPRIRLIHLELHKSESGLWRVDPPQAFLMEPDRPADETDDDLDSDLLDAFPEQIREAYPATPQPTADAARQAVTATLQSGDPASLMRFIQLSGDLTAARESCVRAAQHWWTLREPSTLHHAVPLGIHEQDGKAAATFQFFSARQPERFAFKTLYFKQFENGWLWTPSPSPDTKILFSDWVDLQNKEWQKKWSQALLADCTELINLPETGSPSEDAARELIESWLQATHDGDIKTALRLTARLKLPDSDANLLRNLGYEMMTARKSRQMPTITSIRTGEGWATAGIRTMSDGKPIFPLYPIVTTPSGPRILLEADLSTSGVRSRDFLNKSTMERLEKSNPAAAGELKKLFSQHQAAAGRENP